MPATPAFNVEIEDSPEDQAGGGWRPLEPGKAVVAFARPEDLECGLRERFLSVLSEEEKQRMARFRFERDRLLYLSAHGLLRLTLSRYAGVEPREWDFRAGPQGRPEIGGPASRMRFSLSHTRGLAACAIVLDHAIGVDVEDLSRNAPDGVAERFFAPAEARDVRETAPASRSERFFTYWTLKEAYAKARGLGLAVPLNRFSLHQAEEQWRIAFEPPLEDDPDRWHFWSWRAGEDHQAALAIACR